MNLLDNKHLLPPIICEIADIIGFKDTEKLIEAIGGTSFLFGAGVRETPRLKILYNAIGKEQTHKLLAVFKGDCEYIPRCAKALRELRNHKIRQDYQLLTQVDKKSGRMALQEICPKYQVSDRTVYEIINDKSYNYQEQNNLF